MKHVYEFLKGVDKILNEELERINELAKKAKTVGLTEEERNEQKCLRERYLKRFRQAFEKHLLGITIIDKHGNDVTPEKLKQAQKKVRGRSLKWITKWNSWRSIRSGHCR